MLTDASASFQHFIYSEKAQRAEGKETVTTKRWSTGRRVGLCFVPDPAAFNASAISGLAKACLSAKTLRLGLD